MSRIACSAFSQGQFDASRCIYRGACPSSAWKLVHGKWPFEHTSSYWPIPENATIAMMVCRIVMSDRNCGQTRCALNQLKLAGRGAALHATVHLQRSKQFIILRNNTCGTKSMQTKKRCDPGNCGMIGYNIVARQGNERNHVSNLR